MPNRVFQIKKMLFLHVFRTLQGKRITVHVKNGIVIEGTLQSIDHFYNIKLINTETKDAGNLNMVSTLSTAYIRGTSVLYIELPKDEIDLNILHDATRRQEETET